MALPRPLALVEYSDSSESDVSDPELQMEVPQSLKRKRDDPIEDPPPLPSAFHDLYSSSVRLSNQDDPALHGGKERIRPHIEGQWPSHIYIECESSSTTNSSTMKTRMS